MTINDISDFIHSRTPEEDEIIVRMQQIWGNQWAKITTMLPGRTDNAVKNRFHATLRATKGKKTSSGRNIQMKYDMDDDDFDSTSVDVSDDSDLPVAQPCSIIIEGDVKYAANYNGVSLKDLNSMLPSAQASARVSNGQIMGRVIQSEGHFCSNIVADLSDRDDDFDISPSPINESIGSIETVQMDLENSIFTENFVPLEIDIDGLRDWMGDDMDCDDNIQEEDSNSCFSKIKNEARGFMNNGWKNDDKQSGNRTWGGFTTSLCDRGFSPSDNDRQSFHNSQFKDSAGNFCSSLSYNYLSGR